MKERPILFSGPMVRSILEGRKTVTRRVIKPQPSVDQFGYTLWQYKGVLITEQNTAWAPFEKGFPEAVADGLQWLCPYGKPGDRLWVRESFTDLRGTGIEHRPDPDGPLQRYAFAADSPPGSYSDDARKDFGIKWKPSIHMPRVACRILLEITSIRVERLQGISEQHALAEGISPLSSGRFHCGYDEEGEVTSKSPITAFAWLWNSINGEGGWAANPWVWVVEFKRVEQGE